MSSDSENLGAEIMRAAATGKIGAEEMGAMFAVLGGAPLLRETRDPATGQQTIGVTLDANGKLLVAGGVYLFRGERVKVLREEFGAGNIMETYYRVFYLDRDFREGFTVANARHENGYFGPPVYRSSLVPVDEKAPTKETPKP